MENLKFLIYILTSFVGQLSLITMIISMRWNKDGIPRALLPCVISMFLANVYETVEYYADNIIFNFMDNELINIYLCNIIYSALLFFWILFIHEITGGREMKAAIKAAIVYIFVYLGFSIFVMFVPVTANYQLTGHIQEILDYAYIAVLLYVTLAYIRKTLKMERLCFAFFATMALVMYVGRFAYIAKMYMIGPDKFMHYSTGALDWLLVIAWLTVNMATLYLVYQMVFKPTFIKEQGHTTIWKEQPEQDEQTEDIKLMEEAAKDNQRKQLYDAIERQYNLTRREREVFELIAEGNSNASICEKLYISQSTVKGHVRNIFNKTGIKSRWEVTKLINSEKAKNDTQVL